MLTKFIGDQFMKQNTMYSFGLGGVFVNYSILLYKNFPNAEVH